MNLIGLLCIISLAYYYFESRDFMEDYRFTAFEKNGETLFDEVWNFENDLQAKQEGQKKIEEIGAAEKTHRLVNSQGKLILFHI